MPAPVLPFCSELLLDSAGAANVLLLRLVETRQFYVVLLELRIEYGTRLCIYQRNLCQTAVWVFANATQRTIVPMQITVVELPKEFAITVADGQMPVKASRPIESMLIQPVPYEIHI